MIYEGRPRVERKQWADRLVMDFAFVLRRDVVPTSSTINSKERPLNIRGEGGGHHDL